jgi:hypothetical protein
MQKSFSALYFILIFLLFACNNNDKETGKITPVASAEDAQSYFPVTEFLLGQLKEIDSLPVTPLKIITNGNKKDSIWMKKKDIRPFAAAFLHPVIDSSSMQKYFGEKSFMDQTINAVTLSYDPKIELPDSIKLNHFDVYIDPEKNKVQRIYMVKEEVKNDETETTQFTWKVNEWCSIRTIKQAPGKDPEVKEEIMKWGFNE